MIITCDNCDKKFDINSNLIPKEGRLLECGSCNYQWFFKIDALEKTEKPLIINDKQDLEKNLTSTEKIENTKKEAVFKEIGIIDKNNNEINENKIIKENAKNEKNKIKILNLIIIFIVSSIAFIILLDTFKSPLSTIIPNIELILYNLYESIQDLKLFFIDLI